VARARDAPYLIALDSSCLVALVCGWHEHQAATASLVEHRLARGARMAIAAPALVEAYAVLTRLPSPHRLAAPDALELLRANFEEATAVALSAREYWALLLEAPPRVYGGRTYDAVIAACAQKASVRELVTLNVRHFEGFASDSLQIVSPIDA
jgi:predicted nucleic acid-binding protein